MKRKLKNKKIPKYCEIFEKIITKDTSKPIKCKKTKNFACNTDDFLEKNVEKQINYQNLLESNNIIQCEINGKITIHTLQGEKSFNGIGSLKLNLNQNENSDVVEKNQVQKFSIQIK